MSSQGTSSQNVTGQVKWFNSRAGYGFLTVTDGEKKGTDVFVHHSRINVAQEQYKYLVQGEYVQFEWVETDSSDHEWQAGNVSGMNGGRLMCETRHSNRVQRGQNSQGGENSDNRRPRRSRQNMRGTQRQELVGPEGEVWEVVKRRKPSGSNGSEVRQKAFD